MCHDDVGIFRNFIPMRSDLCAPFPVESPIMKPGSDGRSPDPDPFDLNLPIIQVNNIFRNQLLDFRRTFFFEIKIVVARNEDFMAERQRRKPLQEVDDLRLSTLKANITCMEEHVSFRELQS